MSKPFEFHTFEAEDFPILLEYVDAETGQTIETHYVDGPEYQAVPGFSPREVAIRLTYRDGASQEIEAVTSRASTKATNRRRTR